MIKRILIFVVLLAVGFLLLYSLVDAREKPGDGAVQGGDAPSTGSPSGHSSSDDSSSDASSSDASSRSGSSRSGAQDKKKPPESNPQGPGIQIPTKGNKNSAVSFVPRGSGEIPRHREIALPSGAHRQVLVYKLKFDDSRAEPDNRLSLEGVTIEFFRLDDSDASRPQAIKNGEMRASKARLELSQDSNNNAQIAEDKLMEFWDVVYTTGSDTKARRMQVTLEHALAVNTEDQIHLWTRDSEPVQLEISGGGGFTVTGKGLDAWVPSARNAKGEVSLTSSGARRIEILHDPVLTRDGTTLRADGPLRIIEHAATSAIRMTMLGNVSAVSRRETGAETGRAPQDSPRLLTVRGDSLLAELSRIEVDGKDTFHWRRLVLIGAPARLASGPDGMAAELQLDCRRLTIRPDAHGDPFWVTAEGDKKTPPQLRQTINGKTNTYHCDGRVHLIQVRRQHESWLRPYGLVATIPAEFDQVLMFEGAARVVSPADGLELQSSRGITLFRSERPELRDSLILRGHGDVRVTSAEIRATGNRGFVLHQQMMATGDERRILRVVRLGPERADAEHRYEVQRVATAGSKFALRGSGFCSIKLIDQQAEELHLSSLADDIDIKFATRTKVPSERAPTDQNHLRDVQTLDVWFLPSGTPSSFIAKGKDCHLTFVTRSGVVHAKGTEVRQLRPDVYRLVGTPAEVRSEEFGLLRGRDVLVQQISDEDVRLRATRDAELHMHGVPGQPGSQQKNQQENQRASSGRKLAVELRADEIRAEPFLMPPMAKRLHEGQIPAHVDTASSSRYLFATGNVAIDYKVEEAGRLSTGRATGDDLTMRSDRDGKLFTEGILNGSPAVLERTNANGNRSIAASRRVTFFLEREGEHVTLHPQDGHLPVLRLLGATDSGPNRLMLTCDGRIESEPTRVVCHGPVSVRSLDARGAVDPTGYEVDATSLWMKRAPDGAITEVHAGERVEFRWGDASGTCDDLTIDVAQNQLTARGGEQPAQVRVPAGSFAAGQINYDYRTKMVGVWKGQVLTIK